MIRFIFKRAQKGERGVHGQHRKTQNALIKSTPKSVKQFINILLNYAENARQNSVKNTRETFERNILTFGLTNIRCDRDFLPSSHTTET